MLDIADFVPPLELSARDGSTVPLRPREDRTTLIVTVHGPECGECRDYLRALGGLQDDLRLWDARMLIVSPAPGVEAPLGTVLADPRRQLPETGSASVLVCDRYGQIFEAFHAGAAHSLPAPRDLSETLKFIGTLCPE